MATYYWLGIQASTGTGNVNIPRNWTTIGPSASSGTIPPSGTTIPGNGDNVVFTRFIGATATFPLFSPGGTLGTGVSGTTGFILSVDIQPQCPVAIGICGQGGIDEPFRVNVTNVCNLITNTNSPAITGAHYIQFMSNKIGLTPATYDPRVNLASYTTSGVARTVRFSGVVGNLFVGDAVGGSPSNAILYLKDITLSGSSVLPPAIYRALNVAYGSRETIYISETAKINSMSLQGNSKTYISPGFGTTGSIQIVGNTVVNPQRIPTLDFTPEGICGFSYGLPLVSQVNNLGIVGGGIFAPLVNVYHGLGISYLDQNGGVLSFNVPPGSTGIMCSVYEGVFDVQGASVLKSEYPTVTLGEGSLGGGGSLIVKNQAGPGFGDVPRIQMKGIYDVEINPYTES